MIGKKLAGYAVLLTLLLAAVGPASAVVAAQQPAQPSQQNEFVPVKQLPAQQEQLPAAPLVMGAYAFVWVALLVYVWSVSRRVAAVRRELAELRRRTERKG